jgi:hypothetical protein
VGWNAEVMGYDPQMVGEWDGLVSTDAGPSRKRVNSAMSPMSVWILHQSITHMAFFRFRHPSSSHILGLVIDLFHPYTSLSARPSLPSALRPTMGTGRWTNWKGKVKHVNLLDKICNQSTSLQCIWGIFMMILKLFPSYSSRCLSGEELLGCTAGSHSVSASSRMVLESLDKICIYTFMLYVSS